MKIHTPACGFEIVRGVRVPRLGDVPLPMSSAPTASAASRDDYHDYDDPLGDWNWLPGVEDGETLTPGQVANILAERLVGHQ